jgi:hypothetical protein
MLSTSKIFMLPYANGKSLVYCITILRLWRIFLPEHERGVSVMGVVDFYDCSFVTDKDKRINLSGSLNNRAIIISSPPVKRKNTVSLQSKSLLSTEPEILFADGLCQ